MIENKVLLVRVDSISLGSIETYYGTENYVERLVWFFIQNVSKTSDPNVLALFVSNV